MLPKPLINSSYLQATPIRKAEPFADSALADYSNNQISLSATNRPHIVVLVAQAVVVHVTMIHAHDKFVDGVVCVRSTRPVIIGLHTNKRMSGSVESIYYLGQSFRNFVTAIVAGRTINAPIDIAGEIERALSCLGCEHRELFHDWGSDHFRLCPIGAMPGHHP